MVDSVALLNGEALHGSIVSNEAKWLRLKGKTKTFTIPVTAVAYIVYEGDVQSMVGQDQATLNYDEIGAIALVRVDDVWPANV